MKTEPKPWESEKAAGIVGKMAELKEKQLEIQNTLEKMRVLLLPSILSGIWPEGKDHSKVPHLEWVVGGTGHILYARLTLQHGVWPQNGTPELRIPAMELPDYLNPGETFLRRGDIDFAWKWSRSRRKRAQDQVESNPSPQPQSNVT